MRQRYARKESCGQKRTTNVCGSISALGMPAILKRGGQMHSVLRESGTHDELLAQRGLYYRLFELQYAAMAKSDRLVAG